MEKEKTSHKSQDGEKAREIRSHQHANPPAPSNPMHRNRRIPYTNAYQRVSTSAYTCHSAGLQYGQRKCDRPFHSGMLKKNRQSLPRVYAGDLLAPAPLRREWASSETVRPPRPVDRKAKGSLEPSEPP